MRTFLIVATGSSNYGEMALNLCLSIKANGNHNVVLIHTESAVSTIRQRLDKFDITLNQTFLVEGFKNPAAQAFVLKLCAYEFGYGRLSAEGLQEFILLDADTMILPDKNLNEWFEQKHDFVAYYNDSFNYQTREYQTKAYHFWCDPLEIKDHFKISDNAIMPQINASFIFFRKSEIAKQIFETAQDVWADDFPHKLYRGSKTEEVCFNISCAMLNYTPHQVPYRPLYLQCSSERIDENYIQHRFKAFSMAGHIRHDQRIVSLYNNLADYYRGYFGIKDQFHFKQDLKLCKEQKQIYGYWHIAMMGDWKKVVKEQLNLLVKSELLKNTNTLYIGCVGDHSDFEKVCKMDFNGHAEIHWGGSDLTAYEFPTLDLLKRNANRMNGHFGYYIHTKGVSNPEGKHWRDFLNHFNITKWRDCQYKLRQGYDLCGVKLLQAGTHPMHFSGNFWHFDSEYIRTLKPVDLLDQTNRFNAEMWVCSNRPTAATLSQKMIDHYNHEKFKESKTAVMSQWLSNKIKLWKK